MEIFKRLFVKISLASVLTLLLTVGAAFAQTFPQGLIGLSSEGPATLYSMDTQTGEASPIVTLNGDASFTGLSYIEGTLYGTDLSSFPGSQSSEDIGSISPDGTITFLGDQDGSSNWWGLASNDCGANVLYSHSQDTGALVVQFPDGTTQTIGDDVGVVMAGMAYDDLAGILYGHGEDGFLYTISTTTGALTLIGDSGLGSDISVGLAFDEIDRVLYFNMSETLYTLNVNTGEPTLVGPNLVFDEPSIDGLAWLDPCITQEVPTLSEWGLIAMAGLLGIVGFMVVRRRQVVA